MNAPVELSLGQVGLAACLLLVNAGLSWLLRLDLGKRLLVAGARAVVQLSLLGYLLTPIFRFNHPGLTLSITLVMVGLASIESLRRVGFSYNGAQTQAFIAILLSTAVTAWLATHFILQVQPWWHPRYLIPLVGMLLGNSLTGLSLGLDTFLSQLVQKKDEVEAMLGLGASPWEAALPLIRQALKKGLIPILNSMSVVGLVTIPGMMTGQLLGGTSPILAAKYQMMILFLIAAATAVGTTCSVLLAARHLFDNQARLRLDYVSKK